MPQKKPLEADPEIRSGPSILTLASVTPAWFDETLKSRLARAAEGNVKRAIPECLVTLNSVRIFGAPSETAYHPGALSSSACENGARADAGSAGIAPVVGRTPKSPKTLQPGPLRCVRLNPVMS